MPKTVVNPILGRPRFPGAPPPNPAETARPGAPSAPARAAYPAGGYRVSGTRPLEAGYHAPFARIFPKKTLASVAFPEQNFPFISVPTRPVHGRPKRPATPLQFTAWRRVLRRLKDPKT